jgi:predicted O-methyltransferase YrrM
MIQDVGRRLLRSSYRFQVSYIHAREHFPYILNSRKLFGEGAEIGVQDGYFSRAILDVWKGRKLYSIDPWMEFASEEYIDIANIAQSEQENRYQGTVETLKRFGERSHILRQTSEEAADRFREGQLDFAYLDAQHTYEAVKQDLALYYPKIKKGGVLAGHDYLDGHLEQGIFGVKSAVDEFASNHGLKVVASREKEWCSWFIFL